MSDILQLTNPDFIALILTLISSIYYLKGRLDALEKRIEDLIRNYDNRLEQIDKRFDSVIYLLNKRINGLETTIKKQ